MANKKKATTKRPKSATTEPSSNVSTAGDKTLPASAASMFTKAQFTALLFLAIGASKVMLFSAAAATKLGEDDTMIPSKTCIDHLGESVCLDPSVQLLLQRKYHAGIQTFMLSLACMLLSWHQHEGVLARFNAVLVMTPTGTAAGALQLSSLAGKVFRQTILAPILTAVAWPTLEWPFRGPTARPSRTLQGVALSTVSCYFLYQALLLVVQPHSTLMSMSMEPSVVVTSDAQVVVWLLAVDYLTQAALTLFCWFHFHHPRPQKSLLIWIAGLQLVYAFFQLPDVLQGDEQTTALSLALWAVVCALAPTMAF